MTSISAAEAQRRREEHNEWFRGWLKSLRWCQCAKPYWVRQYLAQRQCLGCGRVESPQSYERRRRLLYYGRRL